MAGAGTPSIKPHAVRYAGSYNFTYDCNGNMLTRNDSTGNFAQTWDRENRLTTVTGSATANFVYDGDGSRVLQLLPDGSKTAYAGALEVTTHAPHATACSARLVCEAEAR